MSGVRRGRDVEGRHDAHRRKRGSTVRLVFLHERRDVELFRRRQKRRDVSEVREGELVKETEERLLDRRGRT